MKRRTHNVWKLADTERSVVIGPVMYREAIHVANEMNVGVVTVGGGDIYIALPTHQTPDNLAGREAG